MSLLWKLRIFGDEACTLVEQAQIKKLRKTTLALTFSNMAGAFYLKWYGFEHPSALASCPRLAVLKKWNASKQCLWNSPKGKQSKPRSIYVFTKITPVLSTPNSETCYIDVDGQRYWCKDGESVIFDETFVHETRNDTEQARLILFFDITRPQKSSFTIYSWMAFQKIMPAKEALYPAKQASEIVLVQFIGVR